MSTVQSPHQPATHNLSSVSLTSPQTLNRGAGLQVTTLMAARGRAQGLTIPQECQPEVAHPPQGHPGARREGRAPTALGCFSCPLRLPFPLYFLGLLHLPAPSCLCPWPVSPCLHEFATGRWGQPSEGCVKGTHARLSSPSGRSGGRGQRRGLLPPGLGPPCSFEL